MQYNPQLQHSPLPHANEGDGDGEGGAATPAFEAHINNTPGAAQLSMHTLHRTHSSKSTNRLPPNNAQHSPSGVGLVTPKSALFDQPSASARNGDAVQVCFPYLSRGSDADPLVHFQISPDDRSSGSTSGANGKTPSPGGRNVNDSSVDALAGLPSPPNTTHPSTDVANGSRQQILPQASAVSNAVDLPASAQQGQPDMSRSAEPPRNAQGTNLPDAPVPAQTDPGVNPDPPLNPDEGDGGVDFGHLLGNDLFNGMNSGEDGAEYDINFANFGMDGDIFEIYMNDGYDGGAQAGEGS